MQQRPFWWIVFLSYAGFIFYWSSLSDPPGSGLISRIPLGDKLVHATEYMVFALLALKAMQPRTRSQLLVTFVICLVYAAFDEVHQYFVPLREASPFDALADFVGVVTGFAVNGAAKGIQLQYELR